MAVKPCIRVCATVAATSDWLIGTPVMKAETSSRYFVPGQVVVEFELGTILLPPNPGLRFIALEQVPVLDSTLRSHLKGLKIIAFEVFARHWRRIESQPDTTSIPEDYVPVRLRSFRDIYDLHFSQAVPVEDMAEPGA
jgi:hypothetical protein